jgi:hypothetical protein
MDISITEMKIIYLRMAIVFRRFEALTFLLATAIIGLLSILTFIAALAKDEGTIGTNPVWTALAKLFYLLRFSTHNIFWSLFADSRNFSIFFFGGLLINCLLYGLLIERIIAVLRLINKKNKQTI